MSDYKSRWNQIYPGADYCSLGLAVFKEFSKGCKNFVETGTAGCGGLVHAFKIGFDNYYSVDIDSNFYNNAMYIFEENDNVSLVQGESYEALEVWLNEIEGKCLFWLDAHPNNPNEKTIPNKILTEELNKIKNHSFKEHTILVDDIPIYFDVDDVKEQILEINPEYKFKMRPSASGPEVILCAYIGEK
jgi:hypothetical protein